MSAVVVQLIGNEPVTASPPPALAHARRVANAYDFLGEMAERVSLVAAGDVPPRPTTDEFGDAMRAFLDLWGLINADQHTYRKRE